MKIIIATGGTGGHIYPAISLAKMIKEKKQSKCDIIFFGTSNHMESTIVPSFGFKFVAIDAVGFNGSIINKLKASTTLIKSFINTQEKIKEINPDIVIGFGGYVSAPVILAASKLGYPTLLHEQNSCAGKANRFLAKFANKVVTCYKEVEHQFPKEKVVLLGNPRASEVHTDKRNGDLLSTYGLVDSIETVLIVMGSQGSESMNKLFVEVLSKLKEKPYQTIYVTGKRHYKNVTNEIDESDNVKIVEYVETLPLYPYLTAIVSRGGATSAAEISAASLASIIIPSPYVPHNHQVINAQAMVNANSSIMIEEKDMSTDLFVEKLDSIMLDSKKRNEMSEAAQKLGKQNAAFDIIELIDKMVGDVNG